MAASQYKGKVVLLTAIEVEYMAVRNHLAGVHEETYLGTVYERGSFATEKWLWEVGIGQIGAGNSASAAAVERAITYFHPEIILFVGIAGGVKDVNIGDVVAATKAYGYESGKVVDTGFVARPEVGLSSHRLVERAKAEARKKTWLRRIPDYPHLLMPEPRTFVGPIAAGEKVVASTNSDLFRFLQSHYNDTLAVEMEGRGFFEAAHANERTQALIIRGISDLIDNKSQYDRQGSQEKAADHAAAFAFEVLAQLDIPEDPSISNGSAISKIVFPKSRSSFPQQVPASGTTNGSPPVEIYYSFAHTRDDETLVEQFARQLAILRNQKRITEWGRRKVIPGQIVNAEVTKHLNAAHIILLFISPDYMASDECFHEMQLAVEKRALQNTIIIPILLRPVALLEETPFAHIQGFPRNGRPISELGNRKGAVFAEIANEISAIVKKFQVDG